MSRPLASTTNFAPQATGVRPDLRHGRLKTIQDEIRRLRLQAFVKVGAFRHRVLHQDGVKLGSFDLECVGLGGIDGLGEIEHVRSPMVVRHHFRAVLDDADLFDFRETPSFFNIGSE